MNRSELCFNNISDRTLFRQWISKLIPSLNQVNKRNNWNAFLKGRQDGEMWRRALSLMHEAFTRAPSSQHIGGTHTDKNCKSTATEVRLFITITDYKHYLHYQNIHSIANKEFPSSLVTSLLHFCIANSRVCLWNRLTNQVCPIIVIKDRV